MSIYNSLVFSEAIDQVEAILKSQDSDDVANRLEHIANNEDLAISCLFLLVVKLKGGDISGMTGVEMANVKPTIADLILPPGVKIP